MDPEREAWASYLKATNGGMMAFSTEQSKHPVETKSEKGSGRCGEGEEGTDQSWRLFSSSQV